MKRVYLLSFNDFMGSQQSVLDFLDTRTEILNWASVLPHSVIIVSDYLAPQIATIIRDKFPGRFFIISELVTTNIDGWLPKKTWELIQNPISSGRWRP